MAKPSAERPAARPAAQSAGRPAAPPDALPRLRHQGPPAGLREHLDRYGPLPLRRRDVLRGEGLLIDSIERAGLTGRGGGGFPAGRKMRAVLGNAKSARGDKGRPVVVANGVESEPLSAKDRALLGNAPHLVIDGICLAAESIGANEAFLCVPDDEAALHRDLIDAVAARDTSGSDAVHVRLIRVPPGYVASEESALVHLLNGGQAVPTFVPPRPFERGVRGRPTLVHNVETLAHIALIARYGPGWFRGLGTRAAPGSALVTVSGAVRRPGVHEIALGTGMSELLAVAGGPAAPPQAILAGGYFGGWLPATAALAAPVSDPDLRAAGASLGAGIVAVLPESACGIAETARIARYLAGQSAGQCGPCVRGLPAIADALEQIAWRGRDARTNHWLGQLLGLVAGRGACHLPDGVTRLVASALRTFAPDVRQHVRRGPCDRARRPPTLPPPGTGPESDGADRHGRPAPAAV
jgi:NADH:ubiquinone oxidoreductase subunit F (NADH-binding)